MKTYLEPEEVEALEQAAVNLRDRLVIRLLFRLGCRVSEALGVTVEDIDFTEGSVTIQHLKNCWMVYRKKKDVVLFSRIII